MSEVNVKIWNDPAEQFIKDIAKALKENEKLRKKIKSDHKGFQHAHSHDIAANLDTDTYILENFKEFQSDGIQAMKRCVIQVARTAEAGGKVVNSYLKVHDPRTGVGAACKLLGKYLHECQNSFEEMASTIKRIAERYRSTFKTNEDRLGSLHLETEERYKRLEASYEKVKAGVVIIGSLVYAGFIVRLDIRDSWPATVLGVPIGVVCFGICTVAYKNKRVEVSNTPTEEYLTRMNLAATNLEDLCEACTNASMFLASLQQELVSESVESALATWSQFEEFNKLVEVHISPTVSNQGL